MSSSDIKSVGLTPQGEAILDDIDALDWFPTREAAAKFAMALAIRKGLGHRDDQDDNVYAQDVSGAKTGWAVGNFDPDGEIVDLLRSLYPDSDTPVRLMRKLINDGLMVLQAQLAKSGLAPVDLFSE